MRKSPSRQGWALLLLAVIVAALLRFWQIGDIPQGLYRDEAFNGLDALRVLAGEHALFFPANNGREPAYIYLTSLAITLLGQTVIAVRISAAVTGTLTTPIFYFLGKSWFGRRAGLLAAWLWAVTFWPVQLSRVGFRTVLFVATLALAFWLGTEAFRRQRWSWWIGAGLVYALSFYTYLGARFTPVLLLLLLLFLVAQPQFRPRLWPGAAFFAGATMLGLIPLISATFADLQLFLGRSQQVSILNPAVNGGAFWSTLWRQVGLALGLTVWRGDMIWRHNLPGRPALDLLMAALFLVGLSTALWRWRKPAMAVSVMWLLVMLGPTILADDAPHFLRAAGALPPLLLLTALGLSKLRDWPKLPSVLQGRWSPAREQRWRNGIIILLCGATLLLTVRDYFFVYARQAETAYFFEAAAKDLAEQINSETVDTAVYVDERYWNGSWPAINFLVAPSRQVIAYSPETGVDCGTACRLPLSFYAWPYLPVNFIPAALGSQVEVTVQQGKEARGDLELEAYPFFNRYHADPVEDMPVPLAEFDGRLQLVMAEIESKMPDEIRLALKWTAPEALETPVKIFVHVVDQDGNILAQSDSYPAEGQWPLDWWRTGVYLREERVLDLGKPFDMTNSDILIGIYDPATEERLLVVDAVGNQIGDAWLMPFTESR